MKVVLFLTEQSHGKEIKEALEKNGVDVKWIPKINLKAIKWLLLNDYDVIHSRNYSFDGFIGSIFSFLKRAKLTMIIRGIGEMKFRKERKNLFSRFLTKLFEFISLRKADHVFFISRDVEDYVLEKFPYLEEKSSIMHNGIDIERFGEAEGIEISEEFSKIEKEDNILITVTNLGWKHPYKAEGVKLIIDSLERVVSKTPDTKFLVVGGGELLKECKKHAQEKEYSDNIIFTGYVDRGEIPPLLKSSDIFVYSSSVDGYPTVILESKSAGLPIIAGEQAGIPETVGEEGITVEPKPSKFADEIIKMIKNPDKRKEYSEKALNSTESWGEITEKYIEEWRELNEE